MKGFFKWIIEEGISVLPAVLYFAVAFNLIHFAVDLSLREEQIPYFSYTTMTIAALIVGKVFIIANTFPIINRFPNRPLIFNIFWKFFIYAIFIFLFSLFDVFIRLYLHGNSWAVIQFRMQLELTNNIFWSVQLWVMLLLFNFVIYSEFIHALGRDKVKQMLFG